MSILNPGQPGSGVSLADDVANTNATSAAQVDDYNQKRTNAYQTVTYPNYVAGMRSGGTVAPANQVVPDPPLAFVLSPPDALGFQYPILGTAFVCPPGPAVINLGTLKWSDGLAENTIDIGVALSGAFFSTGPQDTWPANKSTPPLPAGPTYPAGVYLKIPAPVGSRNITWPDGTVGVHGGWYEKVS